MRKKRGFFDLYAINRPIRPLLERGLCEFFETRLDIQGVNMGKIY